MHLWFRNGMLLVLLCPALGRAAEDSLLSPGESPPPMTPVEPASPTDLESLVARVKPAVVVVSFSGRDGGEQGLGSGFVVDATGLIATNLHVLGEARPITVQTADGRRFPVTQIHATDRAHDLALIRIEAEGLTALPLGDSETLRQGQPVIAVGHPLGLEQSVVQGIVSALREDVDGQPMIQLAIPIERGNSGGPVVDLQGRVQGLVTLKSQVTDNLGYAVAINALQPLLEHPNPLPMDRWLTIGKLNPRLWEAPADVRWRQRAGRITVEGTGAGFGGRSLCLWQQPVPELPCELAVAVRMDQEDGAAGLVFHADGGDRHYGFYPSSGNLRFSRFDGPDVFSWQVLDETRSPHYRPGEWNHLRVRLADGLIQCYCNDALIFESRDARYTSGRCGLAKFRHTTAEFKGFETAPEVRRWSPSAETARSIASLVEGLPASRPPDESLAREVLAEANAADAGTVLREQARELEQRAERLRQLAGAVHAREVGTRLERVFGNTDQPVDIVEAALLIAHLDNEDLDVAAYRQQVDAMATELKATLPETTDAGQQRAALDRFLFEELGYHGSRTNYHHASNSYLNEVIDDREGLPITLSVLYLGLAERIGLPAEGIGLPGHFVVGVRAAPDQLVLVDVFDRGQTLPPEEAAARVEALTGLPWQQDYLTPQTPRDIIIRMLRNLIHAANNEGDPEAALRYVNTLLRLHPDSATDRLFRAVLCYNTRRVDEALADVDWLVEHEPDDIPLFRVRQLLELLEQQKEATRRDDE